MGEQMGFAGWTSVDTSVEDTNSVQGYSIPAKAPEAAALASVERQRISGKRVAELTGTVIRLLAVNPDDWFPHGVLVERTDTDWVLDMRHERGGYLGITRLPRADYLGVEELDVPADVYRKRGLL